MAAIDVEEVLAKLDDKEKIDLLSGIDFWHTKALPQHGVPSLRLSDGPNGVRGTSFFNGVPAACFPCGTGLGATWDTQLLYKAGVMMGEESIAKGAHVLLGPTINMQRSPLGGRGFESLSEDPVLAGLGPAAMVAGIQSKGVAATIKHLVCNDQEHERMAYDAQVSERALREIYMLPFQIAVRDAKPFAFMTAYNKVNGTHVSENKKILQDILRGEWKWEGLVMSDWFGTYSTSEAINAGLDLEMPGPTRWRSGLLQQALDSSKITRHTLDQRARAILTLVKRKVASDAIVLMKNENDSLPLRKDKSTLIIGPNAKSTTFCGGGSASLLPYYVISPYDGISSKATGKISYTVGCYAHKVLPPLGPQVKTADGRTGVTFKVYNEDPTTSKSEAIDTLTIVDTNMFLADYKNQKLKSNLWYAEIEGHLSADEDGEYKFGFGVYGTAKLFVDGKLVIDNATTQTQGSMFFGAGTVEENGIIPLKKGQKYHIKVDFASGPTSKLHSDGTVAFGGGVRLGGCLKIDAEKEIARVASMAKDADQVIICVGLKADWESEGADRANMDLPGCANAMISAVAEANPNTVVVMQSGTPVEIPWIEKVPALIQAWYGGNETGNAIADVLFGDVNPSAKLRLSFPTRVQDNPAYLNYKSQRGRTLYGEDIYIGYRYYEAVDKAVLFPFGHGLSYTTFSFSDLRIKKDAVELSVTVNVKNTGKVSGAEVVQVYIAQRNPSIARPPKELKGYAKVFLEPGMAEDVEVKIEMKYAVSFWDEARKEWIMERDTYEVLVNDSSSVSDKTLTGHFQIEKTSWWIGL